MKDGKVNRESEHAFSDTVFIRHLELFISIGIHPHEREKLQKVLIDVEMAAPAPVFEQEKDLENWIDYEKVYFAIVKLAKQQHFELVEMLAKKIIDVVFQLTSAVSVRVDIGKPEVFDGACVAGASLFQRRS